jgi:DNA-binding helix-hairpin-helix protein with protein kinase domain
MPFVDNGIELERVINERGNRSDHFYANLAYKLSAAAANVHEINGMAIGDFNAKNFLVDPDDAMIRVIDTDAFHVTVRQEEHGRFGRV